MNKTNKGLLIIAAITSILFLFIVESFNNLTLDDLGFASQLQNESIWKFIVAMYFTWQGRFMGFLITGIQLKSFYLFNSMLPFSVVLYILNISLISKALSNFFGTKTIESVIYAILLFQLYVYSMFDISSYFWMCTKGYTLMISLSVFAFSDLSVYKQTRWYDYIILFFTFAFLGCSYEIYAPIILLFIFSVLLYKLYMGKCSIKSLIYTNKRLLFSVAVGLIFFSLMVIAPGNWVRMKVHAKDSNLLFSEYTVTVGKNCIKLVKLLFFKIQYFLAAGILLSVIFQQSYDHTLGNTKRNSIRNRLLGYAFICIILSVISLMLNVYAIGSRMELRAFNHINLILFLFIGFSLYEFSKRGKYITQFTYLFPIAILFIIICNIYCSIRSVPELLAYKDSVKERFAFMETLESAGNNEIVKLKLLDAAEYHSIDDLWRLILPKFSSHVLLKPNEVSNNNNNVYNKEYRKYYNLNFDVVTDLSFELSKPMQKNKLGH